MTTRPAGESVTSNPYPRDTLRVSTGADPADASTACGESAAVSGSAGMTWAPSCLPPARTVSIHVAMSCTDALRPSAGATASVHARSAPPAPAADDE